MSATNDRKMELERKRARLAQIREEKKRIEDEKMRNQLQKPADKENQFQGTTEVKSNLAVETEKLLSELGISPHIPEGSMAASVVEHEALPHSDSLNISNQSCQATPTTKVYKTRGKISLEKSALIQIDVPPRESVFYSKATQTVGDSTPTIGDYPAGYAYEWDDEFFGHHQPPRAPSVSSGGGAGSKDSPTVEDPLVLAAAAGLVFPHVELVKPNAEIPPSEKTLSDDNKSSFIIQTLNDEEREKVFINSDFKRFFERCSKILERALTEKEDDIFVDYSNRGSISNGFDKSSEASDDKLSFSRSFFDERWSRGRCTMALDYNNQHPELIVASYGNSEEAPGEPDGVVLVWNNKFKKNTPEYVFHCQSRVLSVCWAKFHPNLILGGTYNGQICLWDNRQNKRTPVQKSPLSSTAHTHPVYCLKVVGTQNAHNVVTVSTDGRLCSWSLDMFAKPLDAIDLQLKQSRQVAATCLDFPLNDINNFLVGSEDGCVYAGCRHGQKVGVQDGQMFEGHSSLITGLSCHQASGGQQGIDFSNLFLTSSFDWTIKLWNSKDPKPLCSFDDYSDYVMAVGWSPCHPAIFAAGDCQGRLDLWNLNLDFELPVSTVQLPDQASCTKLMWMPSGQQIVAGDDSGRLSVYDLKEQLSNPKPSEWSQMAKVLDEAKQSQAEHEELTRAMALSTSALH